MSQSCATAFPTPLGWVEPDPVGKLCHLGDKSYDKFRKTKAMEDLDTAIQRYREALDATPKVHQDRAARVLSLAEFYFLKYEKTRAAKDLDIMTQLFQEAADITSENDQEYAYRLRRLADAYERQSEKTGAEAPLIRSIELGLEVLAITPEDHSERVIRLEKLAYGYQSRFSLLGAVADLEQAIQLLQEAVQKSEDQPEYNSMLMALGSCYRTHSERTNTLHCLQPYRQLVQLALNKIPEDDQNRAHLLELVAATFSTQWNITKDITNLEQSIDLYQEAIKKASGDPQLVANQLSSLAALYQDKYQETGATEDFEQCIQIGQKALEKTPKDHYDRAFRLRNLADIYMLDKTGASVYSTQAIRLFKEALEITEEDHPHYAYHRLSLAFTYIAQFYRTGTMINLERAIQLLQALLDYSQSPIGVRIDAGMYLLKLHSKVKNWLQAYQAAYQTLSLIPTLTPRFLDSSDKQQLLTRVLGLASNAAAVALLARKTPYEAIGVLELGRGVVAGSLGEIRTDISDLCQMHPQVAGDYIGLRDQLDTPTSQVNQRYDVGQKLETMVHAIRSLSGFERFLMAPSEDELKVAAASGPIVIINVSEYRCDALIIEKHELRSVPLRDLTSRDVQLHAATLVGHDSLNIQLLEWLWDRIVKPVMDALGLSQAPDDRLPRIWWIPTGPLTKFPIHAAGYHFRSSDTVLARAISSYSTSIRALMQSRQKGSTQGVGPEPGKAVLVSMEKTPGQKDLPFAAREIDKLKQLCSSMQLQVIQPAPYRKDMLAALSNCKIFHFAGHGYTDQLDPSRSALLLLGGEELTVSSLFETNFLGRRPFLAYLSACGTGQIKHDGLIDEAIHLITAHQVAGFRHAIGTLWEVNDESCVEAAAITYKWIQERNMTDDSVSEGLHHASIKLRESWISENTSRAVRRTAALQDKDAPIVMEQARPSQVIGSGLRAAKLWEDTPLYWVPYVHYGI